MNSSTAGHYKQLCRLIKYLEQTRNAGVRLTPSADEKEMWIVKGFSDSDWAGDKDDRRSISGWEIFIGSCLIGWGSRSQRCVSLSTSEAEFIAVVNIFKELLFIKNMLTFLTVPVPLPLVVLCDNIGAVYLSKNRESRRTKYMDTKFHFVREYVENNIVVVVFVCSEDNIADSFTKNVTEKILKNHEDKLIGYKA